jgi:hypothetical protein
VTSLSIVSGSAGVVEPQAAATARARINGTTVNTLAFLSQYRNIADPPDLEMFPGWGRLPFANTTVQANAALLSDLHRSEFSQIQKRRWDYRTVSRLSLWALPVANG